MNIYQSAFLNVSKQNETLIQSWTKKNLSVDDYKRELKHFMNLFHKVKPKGLVLDIKECSLIIPKEIDQWMAEQILIPINKRGVKELAFTLADNTTVHRSIATSLEKAMPIIQSSYFSSLEEATHHTEQEKRTSTDSTLSNIEFQLKRDSNSFGVNLNIDANDLPKFLKSMQQIEQDNQFVHDHINHYYSLTIREIEIFKLIALGKTNKEIALTLFIEESSVKSHRKNIKQKLKVTSAFDIYQYARCFQLI